MQYSGIYSTAWQVIINSEFSLPTKSSTEKDVSNNHNTGQDKIPEPGANQEKDKNQGKEGQSAFTKNQET